MTAVIHVIRVKRLTSLEISDLRSLRCTTVHTGAFDAGGLSVVVCYLLNLLCQFSRGGQNQALKSTTQQHISVVAVSLIQPVL